MSDEKKRDRALQRRVRERQKKTGESYQTAWRQLTDTLRTEDSNRMIARFESPAILPTQGIKFPMLITPQELFVDRFAIADAAYWIVNDVKVHDRSLFVQPGDVPAEIFSAGASIILERLVAGDIVEIAASYVGLETSAPLVVELHGTNQPTGRSLSYFLPMSTGVAIAPKQCVHVTGRPERSFIPERVVINREEEWIVGDVNLDPIHRGRDFDIAITRVDEYDFASPFLCGVQGRLL